MKKIIIVLIAVFNLSNIDGQTLLFDKTYGGQFLDSPVFTYSAKNKHYVFGNINNSLPQGTISLPAPDLSEQFGNSDYNMVIYDTAGVKLDDKSFGGLGNDNLIKVIPNANGFYLFGTSASSNDGNKTTVLLCPPLEIWIVTIDFDGNILAQNSMCVPSAFDASSTNASLRELCDVITLSNGGFMFYISIKNLPLGSTSDRVACFYTDPFFNVQKRITLHSTASPVLTTPYQRIKGINIVDLSNGKFAFLETLPFLISSTPFLSFPAYYNFSVAGIVDTATNSVILKGFLNSNDVNTPKYLGMQGGNLFLCIEDTPFNSFMGNENFYSLLFLSSPAIAYLRTAPAHTLINKHDIWILKLDPSTLATLSESSVGTNNDTFINSVTQLQEPANTVMLGCYTKGGFAFDKTSASKGGYDYWLVMLNSASLQPLYDWSFGGSGDDVLTAVNNPPGYLLYSGYSQSPVSGDKTSPSRDGGTKGDYWTLGFCLPPAASFTANYDSINPGNLVSFNNTSSNAIEYYWEFGDGAVSYLKNPVHYYYMPGFYNVTLHCYNPGGCNADVTELNIIYVNALGVIEAIGKKGLAVYPNPASDQIYVSAPEHSDLKIYDSFGRLVKEIYISSESDKKIDVTEFKNGMYFINIMNSGNSSNLKFIKN